MLVDGFLAILDAVGLQREEVGKAVHKYTETDWVPSKLSIKMIVGQNAEGCQNGVGLAFGHCERDVLDVVWVGNLLYQLQR